MKADAKAEITYRVRYTDKAGRTRTKFYAQRGRAFDKAAELRDAGKVGVVVEGAAGVYIPCDGAPIEKREAPTPNTPTPPTPTPNTPAVATPASPPRREIKVGQFDTWRHLIPTVEECPEGLDVLEIATLLGIPWGRDYNIACYVEATGDEGDWKDEEWYGRLRAWRRENPNREFDKLETFLGQLTMGPNPTLATIEHDDYEAYALP